MTKSRIESAHTKNRPTWAVFSFRGCRKILTVSRKRGKCGTLPRVKIRVVFRAIETISEDTFKKRGFTVTLNNIA